MAKTKYKKRTINSKEYYIYRLRHKNLKKPKDIYATTVNELAAKIKSIIRELDNGITNNKEYLGTFFKDWLYNAHLVNKKPSTKQRYDSIYRTYIEDSSIYTIKLRDLGPSDIQIYYKELISSGKSKAAIKMLHKLIAPCIRYAYDNNRIIKDFSRAIIIPNDDEDKKLSKVSEVKPFTLEQQIKFLDLIKEHDLEILFITALNTGLRQGELFALTWKDIDLDNASININKSYKIVKNIATGKYEGIVQTPKTKKSIRTVPIPEFLVNILRKYRLSQMALKLKMGNLYIDNKLVFCNMFGNYLDSSNVLKKFKKVLNEMDLQDKKFHDLRHTFATRMFELGEAPKTVQELLGHANIAITLDTYTHVLESIKIKASQKLNDLYLSMGVK